RPPPRSPLSPYTTLFRSDEPDPIRRPRAHEFGRRAPRDIEPGGGREVFRQHAAGDIDRQHDRDPLAAQLRARRAETQTGRGDDPDRKSTRLNSSHVSISY